ncbi:MAG: threonine--tRNA ligase [Chlamydiae bacterium RIFCSPHIGHO2_12_FULL_44_59]|nr:MAG: threonine--tRNA ligase [Chlamydiae bacterium RIFCSPHIGHO2_01_FULL_44_39]OGN59370.1 MAG: threonine--tRNA ligase [Chlamydiae bacterium RIFCSPHIGHO2_02_FULL_45_9]OGN59961.1 MAG: threonine--tRNA ligase [Chlamydiae bacterium RIFCSPHIGHO2_12_FULL_44_59]OGN66176.1 MAG: threonine--tRNA ligase [Chlamydiae bacterium RIFCSPLOWO2_01_FULL_44_52]OGN69080.1 MAG: threonine--tRNA ligase [Chlamydiae bacterium RIFCSPLOWO2_02_FULL_45_22]OGN69897.1 MAG: threonine--tRNA ligase [Chlamydiae bacterium RIFCSPLO
MKLKVKDQIYEFPEGITPKDIASKLHLTAPEQAVTVSVNGTLRDFNCPLQEGDHVIFWNFDDALGKEVFWHTSAHVLAQAILRLWPNAKPTIGPPIEQGFYYDFGNLSISEEDFPKIEQEIEVILQENHPTERMEFANKEEAKEAFSTNSYKLELIAGFEETPISAYKQGEFFDLCRGPHLAALSKIKAFKILKTSGAYWRGDSEKDMLTRVYGISFPDRKKLKDYLTLLEEAKKRDHKTLGPSLDLFSFKEEAPGMPFIHPRGLTIWNQLLAFLRECLKEANYEEIKTPTMMSRELWERSGHWFHYRENMFTSHVEERDFAIKPMNCPGCMLYYRSKTHSYRELPLRIAEIGHVHRFEPSGALNGLFRVRAFHQDDAHLFMRPDQIQEEIHEILKLADKIYRTFGLPYRMELSTRPEKSKTIGTDEEWANATSGLKGALDDWGHSYRINEGDGAFYGPKIDIHIRDALGRFWQCGTVQLDMSLPEKFDLEYVTATGTHARPIMLHRALFGSIERFFGILIEHFAGKFPFWLSPYQVKIATVADRHIPYGERLQKNIEALGIVCDIDASQESVAKKVRNAQLLKTNYLLTVGDKEVENKTVALRTRDNVVHGEIDIADFLDKVVKERDARALMSPFSAGV